MTSIVNVYRMAQSVNHEANQVLHCVHAANGSSLWVGNLAAADGSISRA